MNVRMLIHSLLFASNRFAPEGGLKRMRYALEVIINRHNFLISLNMLPMRCCLCVCVFVLARVRVLRSRCVSLQFLGFCQRYCTIAFSYKSRYREPLKRAGVDIACISAVVIFLGILNGVDFRTANVRERACAAR